MAFRFRRKESATDGFHRVVREETASAVSLLADCAGDLTERIHEARRSLKRIRAAVRLVRSQMDDDAFTIEDAALREAGKKLSPARDSTATLAAFDALAPRMSAPGILAVRERLRAAVRRKGEVSEKRLAAIAGAVRSSGHTLAQTNLAEDGWALIGPGLADSYRAAWKMRRAARKDPSPSMLHDFRKAVKRLALQVELLRRALGRGEKKFLRRLVKLGDLLGGLNDLDLLRTALAEVPQNRSRPVIDRVLAHEFEKTRKRVFRIARSALTAKPASGLAALKNRWRKWHKPSRK